MLKNKGILGDLGFGERVWRQFDGALIADAGKRSGDGLTAEVIDAALDCGRRESMRRWIGGGRNR
jgi:hypothetical protein